MLEENIVCNLQFIVIIVNRFIDPEYCQQSYSRREILWLTLKIKSIVSR
jgi:hypothetical protein